MWQVSAWDNGVMVASALGIIILVVTFIGVATLLWFIIYPELKMKRLNEQLNRSNTLYRKAK